METLREITSQIQYPIGKMKDITNSSMRSIQSLPNEILCEIFLELDWDTRLNVASLVCKHWFEIISNRKNELYLYSWKRRLEANGKTDDGLKNFLKRFFCLRCSFDNIISNLKIKKKTLMRGLKTLRH